MKNYLPSKQFVRLIGIVLLVSVVVLVLGSVLGKKTIWNKNKKEDVVTLGTKSDDFFAQDSDKDGLYDWEEALWGTDPQKKDTDDDGVSDKEYVDQKKESIAESSDTPYEPDDTNQTEVFAKQLFATSAVLSHSGSFSQEDIESFSANLGQSINAFSIKDIYTLSDLKMGNTSPDTYYNGFGSIYNSLSFQTVDELATIAAVIENPDDETSLSRLATLVSLYQVFQDKLLGLSVPYNASGIHLAIVNDLYRIMEILKEAPNIEIDPLKFSTYIGKYNEYSQNLVVDFQNLRIYFSQNGILAE